MFVTKIGMHCGTALYFIFFVVVVHSCVKCLVKRCHFIWDKSCIYKPQPCHIMKNVSGHAEALSSLVLC
jgi:hypothetical protein